MRTRYVAIVFVLCILLTFTSVQNTSAEPSELKFDDTFSGPYVDKVLYKIISGESNRVLALLDDEIDILDGPISIDITPTLDADPDIELSSILRNGYGQITINCRDAPLNWTALRRAFAFAYDKTEVQSDIFQGYSQLQDSLVPIVNSEFSIEDELPYHYYNPEIAIGNQLLNDSGFAFDPVSGYRNDPNGNPIHIEIAYSAFSSTAGGCAQIGIDALRALGISAETNQEDFNTIIGNMYNHGAYDMVVYGSNFYSNDVDWLASEYWSANAAVPFQNPSNFVNATFDALRGSLLYGSTYMEIYNAASEMQEILHYNVPVLVVHEDILFSAYRTDRFEGHVEDVTKNIENEWTNLKARLKLLEGGPFSGTLRVSMAQEPSSFNPMVTNSQYSKIIFNNIFDSLVRIDPDGNKIPSLAESWLVETHDNNLDVPAGHTRFTFDIIQNASWSDGTPLTAEDITYTFNYYYDSMAFGNPMGLGLVDFVGIYAPIPSMVVMEFSTESYWHLSTISKLPILQKTLLETIGLTGWNTWNPVFSPDPYPTSGPFNLTEYSAGNYVELSYHPNFQRRVRGTGSDQPVVDSPDDMLVFYGTTGHSITWNIGDDNPLVYRLYNNGSLVMAEYYTNSTVEFDIDSQLSILGTYNFTIQVQDWEYQSAVDTVIVEYLSDITAPEVTGQDDFSILDVLSSGTTISWTVFDDNPANYTILLDDVVATTEIWTTDISVVSHDIGILTSGVYNFTILLRDLFGNSITDSTILTVFSDTTSPDIEGPEDVEFILGDSGVDINWNATDDYPTTYSILLDDIEVATGSWEPGVPIVFNLGDLDVGEYNVTILVNDLSGNTNSDSVAVRVLAPGLAPEIMMLLGIIGVAAVVVVMGIVIKVRGAS